MTASGADFKSMTLEEMEFAFIEDFVQFGSRICLSAAIAQFKELPTSGTERKRLAVAVLQQVYTALEDFAVLLTAIMRRKSGAFLHLAMSVSEAQGTTQYPAILKKPLKAKDLFAELGFAQVTVEKLHHLGYEITEADLDAAFSDFATSTKMLGDYVDAFNHPKNRLKHGKAVLGVAFDLAATDDFGHLEYEKKTQSLGLALTSASDDQVKTAIIVIAKLAKMSIELLAMFVAQHHSEDRAEEIVYVMKAQFDEIVGSVKAIGLTSKGLTD